MATAISIRYIDLPQLAAAVELLCSQDGAGSKNNKSVFLPIPLAGKVARIRRLCREAGDMYQELKMGLIAKYATTQVDGSFGVSTRTEAYGQFMKEMKELGEQTFTVDRHISREEIEREFDSISPVVLDGLEPVFAPSVTPIETAAGRKRA